MLLYAVEPAFVYSFWSILPFPELSIGVSSLTVFLGFVRLALVILQYPIESQAPQYISISYIIRFIFFILSLASVNTSSRLRSTRGTEILPKLGV